MSDTCNGCKHYQQRTEECGELQGVVFCPPCNRAWRLENSHTCPRCVEYRQMVEAWECPGAVRSRHCPGFVAKVVGTDDKQLNLF